MAENKKILIAVNTTWNLVNFRSGIISKLQQVGYEVVAVSPVDKFVPNLFSLGCRYIPLPMDNKGTHFGRDLLLFIRFLRVLRKEKPSIFLSYTIKPNIYGSLAAQFLGIPVINNISGLGSTFIHKTYLTSFVKFLYKISLARSKKVFFQNCDDRDLFLNLGIVGRGVADLLPGSGIDLVRFTPKPASNIGKFQFLLIA